MNGKQIKKLIWETNTPPPTNYIWVKPNGKPYEFNNSTKKWEESNCFGGISENMSEEEQMEVRKNLGLYYEESSVSEKEVQYNGESASFDYWAKVSGDTPAKTDIISIAGSPASDEINVGFSDNTDGYDIYPIGAPTGVIFHVILNNSEGHEPGIYYSTLGAEYASMVSLVYKGETTTIHKIDAKFLPEQEGGAIQPVTLLQVPTESIQENNVTRTNYISDEDWNKLVTGKTCIAKYNNNYYLVTVSVYRITIYPTQLITFIGTDGFKFTISTTNNSTNITVSPQNGIKFLNGFPTNEMSSADIENLGFNAELMRDCFDGRIKAFSVNNSLANIISANLATNSGTKYFVEFWTNTDKYVIGYDILSWKFSCTVTPR